jgi:hypothetical protein
MLDTLADGVSAAGVATGGAVILIVGDVYWLDAAIALGIAAIIAYHAPLKPAADFCARVQDASGKALDSPHGRLRCVWHDP